MKVSMVTLTSKVNQFVRKLSQMSTVVPNNRRGECSGRCSFRRSSHGQRVDSCQCCLPEDVPVGCLPVYVGQERRRFVIPTAYLNNSNFRKHLAKSAEEYGLCCQRGLCIACAPYVFEIFLCCLDVDDGSQHWMQQHSRSG